MTAMVTSCSGERYWTAEHTVKSGSMMRCCLCRTWMNRVWGKSRKKSTLIERVWGIRTKHSKFVAVDPNWYCAHVPSFELLYKGRNFFNSCLLRRCWSFFWFSVGASASQRTPTNWKSINHQVPLQSSLLVIYWKLKLGDVSFKLCTIRCVFFLSDSKPPTIMPH